MLGIGGGVLKVPAMNAFCKVPIKVAAATSNFMIGVTAAAGAFIYFGKGYIKNPLFVGLIVIGVVIGSKLSMPIIKKNSAIKNKKYIYTIFGLSCDRDVYKGYKMKFDINKFIARTLQVGVGCSIFLFCLAIIESFS
jgi:uncharacterized membrane protein YfcA